MFDGFETRRIQVPDAELFVRTGGSGAPILLLHGYPQTHACWHRVGPALTAQYTVVCPDLRGYGESSGPRSDATHAAYGKRAMAQDMVALMRTLGHDRFTVVGHDRGGRVAYRLALDHPARVQALAVLDMVPTVETWDRTDRASALGSFHWQFLAQPEPLPERLIGHDPDFFLDWLLRSWAAPGFVFDPAAHEAYRRAFRNPSVIHATCEDYRAGATIDHALDADDRKAGRRIACPVLTLRGTGRPTSGRRNAYVEIWKAWALDVTGVDLDCGHFIPEEAPDDLLRYLVNSPAGRAAN